EASRSGSNSGRRSKANERIREIREIRGRKPSATDFSDFTNLTDLRRALALQFRKPSVASTSAATIPGSETAWPASGTITSFDSGHAVWSSHALIAGHTTS